MCAAARKTVQSPSMLRGMTHAQGEWQQLLVRYALARVVYQLAAEAVDRRSHNADTMTAAFLVEDQARENLAEVRRRMYQVRPLHNGRVSSHRRTAQQLGI
jgi:hypothetical protein